MARSYSKIQIIGNLGADPEMRYTPSGQQVTNFNVAVNNRRRDPQSNQWVDDVDWFRVACWGRQAEIADQYLQKGTRVFVDGRFQARRFTGNDGIERTSLEINASDFVMLSGAPGTDQAGGGWQDAGGYESGQGQNQDDLNDLSFNQQQSPQNKGSRGPNDDDLDKIPF